ncbi:MAG: hypothetical protein M0Q88_01065 [Bacilli bacterium]|nr:hypothetical protein [Bacilli bacterium]
MLKPLKGYGLFMYNLCEKTGLYLSKHKVLFWLLMFTWALPMTILGLLVTLVLLIGGKRPEKYHNTYRFIIGNSWGGLTLGLMFLQSKKSSEHTAMHEYGHIHQVILGPLFPFLVAIPSATRYWYQKLSKKITPPYDEIWFERSATNLGNLIIKGKRKYTKVD